VLNIRFEKRREILPEPQKPTRLWIARAFSLVEDVVYIGLGLILAGTAITLLIGGVVTFGQALWNGAMPASVINLLDRILLVLLVVELLYTVQVSFREHAVVAEPFLLVGLIAAIRRVLVLTVEFGQSPGKSDPTLFQHFVIELGVLTLLIVALSTSLWILRRRDTQSTAERA
jgi:uncharacterized membrane protein (DUF373 family)